MICKKCHGEISGDISFCPLCGEKQKDIQIKNTKTTDNYLCCPRCGSEKLNIMADRDLNSAIASGIAGTIIGGSKVGIVSGLAGLQGRTFFVCLNCGKKFRSPDELKTEIKTLKTKRKIMKALSYFIVFCGLMLLIASLMCELLWLGVIMALPCFGFAFFMKYLTNVKVNKIEIELKEIEEGIEKHI